MLAYFVCPQLCEKDLTNFYFQQDDVSCHIAAAMMQFTLCRKMVIWSDLLVLRIYQYLTLFFGVDKTIDKLKSNIRAEITAIMLEMLTNVMQNA